MPENFPGPYGLEITYVVSTIIHKMNLNCNVVGTPSVGVDAATVELLNRGGSPVNMVTAVDAWLSPVLDMYHTAVVFSDCTLWKYESLSSARTFITSFTLGDNGTSAVDPVLGQQMTLTFRTQEGNTMKLVFLELSQFGDSRGALSGATDASVISIRNNTLAGTNFIMARDTSYPIAPNGVARGQNEVVWRKRFRD